MHIALAVCCLFIARVVSYPSAGEVATNDEDTNNDLQLELRSILNHLDNEQIERSVASDEDESDQDDDAMDKRQGGYNVIKADLKCEIECVGNLRNPSSGQGMSIKEAANACKHSCLKTNRKREQNLRTEEGDEQTHQKSLREFSDDLMEQLQFSDNE